MKCEQKPNQPPAGAPTLRPSRRVYIHLSHLRRGASNKSAPASTVTVAFVVLRLARTIAITTIATVTKIGRTKGALSTVTATLFDFAATVRTLALPAIAMCFKRFFEKVTKRFATVAMLKLACVLFVGAVVGAAAAKNTCPGTPNKYPVVTAPLKLIRTVENGKLYQQTGVSPPVSIMHVYGTPYEMGKAHGQALKAEVEDLNKDFDHYIYELILNDFEKMPKIVQQIIGDLGVDGVQVALEFERFATFDFISDKMKEEMQGFADGIGWSYDKVVRFNLFPELVKAACSMAGAWGKAINGGAVTNGTLYQLRALDWATNGPFQKYPLVLVYHPESNNGHPFASFTWAGILGALTGFSSAPFGICEKVWLHYKGKDNRFGTPWNFVLRDILQYDETVAEAEARINSATRTCSIFVGLGSASSAQGTPDFNVVRYSYDSADVWNNSNSQNYTGHPRFDDLIYVNKHTQPSSEPCLGDLMGEYYGKIDASVFMSQVAPRHQTGNTHLAVYDFAQQQVYFASAGVATPSGGDGEPAYNRPAMRLDMRKMWAEPKP